MHVLEIVGLAKQASLYPFQLSGGMKHRVAVARAWALTGAALLLMGICYWVYRAGTPRRAA